MKKILGSLCLILLIIFLFSSGAFATIITVENATIGKEYEGYKIFEASFPEYEEFAAYQINANSFWFDAVESTSSPFELEPIINSSWYNVAIKSDMSETDIFDWFNTLDLPETSDLPKITATENTFVWEDVEDGYYLITSSLGSIVTVLNGHGDIVIIDKNQYPGWEYPEIPDPEDTDAPMRPINLGELGPGKNISKEGYWYGKSLTSQVGDTVFYKINAFTPRYNLDKRIYEYTFTDKYKVDELHYNDDLRVCINGIELTESQVSVDITRVSSGVVYEVITITIHANTQFEDFPVEGHTEITYSARVLTGINPRRTNTVNMTWIEIDPNDEANFIEPPHRDYYGPEEQPGTRPDGQLIYTYTFGFVTLKTDENGDPLTGAKFLLLDENKDEIKLIYSGGKAYQVHFYYVSDDPDIEGDPLIIHPDDHRSMIFGIDCDRTYYLEEIEAPAGYNMLTDLVEFRYTMDDYGYHEGGLMDPAIYVVNHSGPRLPTTGGIGTKIFIILGISLMFIAAIIFVVRKKLSY